jgi:hypothetical protein
MSELVDKRLVDEAVDSYVDWREERASVWDAYARWTSAPVADCPLTSVIGREGRTATVLVHERRARRRLLRARVGRRVDAAHADRGGIPHDRPGWLSAASASARRGRATSQRRCGTSCEPKPAGRSPSVWAPSQPSGRCRPSAPPSVRITPAPSSAIGQSDERYRLRSNQPGSRQ